VGPGLSQSRVILGLALAGWCGAAVPVLAQAGPQGREGPVWTLEGLRTGQCVRFLLNPTKAPRKLPDGTRLLAASQDETLHPALRSVIDGQPEFAAWIPASLCLYYGDTLTLGARRLSGKDPRKRPMIGLWAVAASEQGRARRELVLSFFGVGSGLVQAAGYTRVKLREARSSVSKVPDTENDLYDVKIGKTRLVWNGRPAGDSTRVEQPIQESWLAPGTFGILWRVQATLRPEWSRALVGVLRVEGKDDLAKALKASPIRFVGPLYQGGGGELRFSR
jgi:hypothetical protein